VAARAAAEPEPPAAANLVSAASTSSTDSDGSWTGAGRAASSVRQPTPVRPCGGLPSSIPTAGTTSASSRSPSSSARAATLARFAIVAAIASATATTLASSVTGSLSHPPPTTLSPLIRQSVGFTADPTLVRCPDQIVDVAVTIVETAVNLSFGESAVKPQSRRISGET
jgi:hypothetical protein